MIQLRVLQNTFASLRSFSGMSSSSEATLSSSDSVKYSRPGYLSSINVVRFCLAAFCSSSLYRCILSMSSSALVLTTTCLLKASGSRILWICSAFSTSGFCFVYRCTTVNLDFFSSSSSEDVCESYELSLSSSIGSGLFTGGLYTCFGTAILGVGTASGVLSLAPMFLSISLASFLASTLRVMLIFC